MHQQTKDQEGGGSVNAQSDTYSKTKLLEQPES